MKNILTLVRGKRRFADRHVRGICHSGQALKSALD